MSAETLTATRAAAAFPVTAFFGAGVVQCAWGTIAVGATVEDGDIFEMCKVPAGATIIGGYLHMEDIDDGTEALDLMLGWAANGTDAADPNGLILAGVKTGDISVHLDVASTFMPFGGVLLSAGPKTLAAETTIQVEANTPSNSFAAGQMTVYVYYTVA
jgi:hypothetical protein